MTADALTHYRRAIEVIETANRALKESEYRSFLDELSDECAARSGALDE